MKILLSLVSLILFISGCSKSTSNIDTLKPDILIDKKRSDPDRDIREFKNKYDGAIIDALTHLDPPSNEIIDESKIDDIVFMYKDENVKQILVGPVPNEGHMLLYLEDKDLGSKIRKKLKEKDNKNIHLYCGSDYISNWLHSAHKNGYEEKELEKVFNKLEKDLNDPDCLAMGEIGVYHFRKSGRQNVIEYAPTFEPFIKIMERISKSNKWVNLHIEPMSPSGTSYENSSFGALSILYKQFPNIKIILSHTAMTSSTNLEQLFNKYPNLVVTFKPIRKHNKWKNLEPITNSKSRLYEDWARLFEKMPERFLVGSDAKFGRYGDEHDQAKYDKRIKAIRRVLGSIEKSAAQKIAYENAIKIFNLK